MDKFLLILFSKDQFMLAQNDYRQANASVW